MKIGINASFLRKQNTGIGQVTLNFLRKLSELEAENSKSKNLEFVLYLEEDTDLKFPNNFVKKIFLPLWKRDDLIRKIWWEKYLLPKKVREDQCDIFISLYQCPTVIAREHSDRGNPVPINSGLLRFARNDTKHIMIVHDIIPKLFPEYLNNARKKMYWNLTEKAIAKVDKILAVSRRTEKDLIQCLGIKPEKISVNYIDVDEIYKKPVSEEKSRTVMRKYNLKPGYIYSGGGLEVRKNCEGVVLAYKKLLEQNRERKFLDSMPELVISGKLLPQLAPLVTDVEKLIHKLNLTPHVRLLDFVPQADLPAIYRNCAVFVYPSYYEGFGLPVLEAMNQGRPVVTAKKSSLPEVGGDAVLYCDPDDVRDIAMVLRNVLTNQHLRETLSARAQEKAKNFSWEKFTDKILQVILQEK